MQGYDDLAKLFGVDPFWLTQIIVFVALTYTCCVFGVVFGKMGRSPFWGFIFLPPYFGLIGLWIFGLGRWPQEGVSLPPAAANADPPARRSRVAN